MATEELQLARMLAEFRTEYEEVTDVARAQEAATWRRIWEDIRDRTVRDILQGADPSQVVARLQCAADEYATSQCTRPERYLCRVPAVDALLRRYIATVSAPPSVVVAAARTYHDALRGPMLHDDALLGWDLLPSRREAAPATNNDDDNNFRWSPPSNPYATPLAFTDPAAMWPGHTRDVLLVAGAAETLRSFLSPEDAAREVGGGCTAVEWEEYRAACRDLRGAWVDMESVACAVCGYPPPPAAEKELARWRDPLRRAEAGLRITLAGAPDAVHRAIHEWLRRVCGCDSTLWAGLRWPPAFTGLLADALAQALTDAPSSALVFDPLVLEATHAVATAASTQRYSVWWLHGYPVPPTCSDLMRHWDAEDDAVAAADGWRWTPTLRAHFRARIMCNGDNT